MRVWLMRLSVVFRSSRPFLLPLSSGVLLGLLSYEVLPAFLVFVALVPFFVFLDRTDSWRARALGGFLAGAAYYLFVLHTLAFVDWFGFIESEHLFMLCMYAALSAMVGAFYGAFAVAYGIPGIRSLSMLLFIPSAFVLIELGKTFLSFGFTWGFLGYLTETMPAVMRGANLAGLFGLTFLIVFVNAAATLAVFAAFEKRIRRAVLLVIGGALAVALVALGGWLVQRFMLYPLGTVRVAVMETKDQRARTELAISPYVQLFSSARKAGAEVILMPESLIDPRRKELSLEDMEALMSGLGQFYDGTMIVGGFRKEDGRTYNSTFFWHDKELTAVYDKHYLVPFAEYAPRLFSLVGPSGNTLYTRGATDQLPEAGGTRFGSLVCQEVNYPLAGIRPTRSGAEILVSGANDGFAKESPLLAWLAPTEDPWFERIEYRFARFRAVENGRYLLRSTKIGIAGIISPSGESLETIASGESDVRVRDIERMGGMTPYTRFGDAPVLAFSALAVLGICLRKRGFLRMGIGKR